MKTTLFMKAEEVATELDVSIAYAYKLIKALNTDLRKRGFITINGRVSRQYFHEKLYRDNARTEKGAKNVSI